MRRHLREHENLDSLLVAFAIGLVVWLMMRRIVHQRARQRMAARQAGPEASGGASSEQRTMPRMGAPGTVTRAQIAELRARHFEPSRHWSREEAQLILDAVSYLRAVILQETGDADPPIEIQNKVLGFILTDDALRGAVLDWSLNRTREEEAGTPDGPPRDEIYERVAAFVTELWQAEAENG